jgi:hypothetical protein
VWRSREPIALIFFVLLASSPLRAMPSDAQTPARPTPIADNESQEGLSIACSPAKPIAAVGETITLRAFVIAPGSAPSNMPQYTWSVTGGRVDGGGPSVNWDVAGLSPGSYTATVHTESAARGVATCTIRVMVEEPHRGEPPRESGRSLLVSGENARAGYGLYSYLLFGSPPNAETQERYWAAIETYWRLIPSVQKLEKYLKPRDLNVTYVPVDAVPGSDVSALWAMQHYDYARARALLRTIPGDHRDGPYIISSLKPISVDAMLDGPYLYQDLSSIPPRLVESWVKEFLNQAAQENPWEDRTGRELALRLRTTLGVAALGLDPVLKGLNSLISWIPKA